ncbi:uncharacterized [Tachysurus ichikawai]
MCRAFKSRFFYRKLKAESLLFICLFVFFDFGVLKPGDIGMKSRDSVIKPMAGGLSNEFLETNYLIARQEECRPPAAQGDHH